LQVCKKVTFCPNLHLNHIIHKSKSQKGRKTESETDRKTDRKTSVKIAKEFFSDISFLFIVKKERDKEGETEREIDRKTYRQKDIKQKDRQTKRQKDGKHET
jgi:hypothetical protein